MHKLTENITKEIIDKLNQEKESLCIAFLKETGLKPSECMICYQKINNKHRIWIEKK